MNFNDPDIIRMMIVAAVFLVPLSMLRGDPYIWRAAVLLGALALISVHPVLGIGLFLAVAAWRPIKFILEIFIGSFVAGLGLRAAGLFRRSEAPRLRRLPRQHPPRQPRIGYRREGRYFPWEPERGEPSHRFEAEPSDAARSAERWDRRGDDLPENL